jgi:hypothetical protein
VTIQSQIDILESLARADLELTDLHQELGRERAALNGKRQRLAELDARLERDRQSFGDMEKVRGELTGEMRQMSAQIEKSREKLARCRTEREVNAGQRELEELRKLYRDREQEVEKLNGLLEQARADIQKTTDSRDGLVGELSASEGDVATRLGELEKRAEERQRERQDLVGRVKPQIYRRYEQIRKRRGTAIAQTMEGTCGACHMLLPPMLFQKLKRGDDFGQCPSCNRILYFRAPPAAEDSPPRP